MKTAERFIGLSLQPAVHKTLKQAPAASFETNCIIGDGDIFVNNRNGCLVFEQMAVFDAVVTQKEITVLSVF